MSKRIDKPEHIHSGGFTLVELMVVVVIIGILTAVAVPAYSKSHITAAKRAHEANVRTLEGAALTAIAMEGLPDSDIKWNKEIWEKDKAGESEGETGGYKPHEYIEKWPDIPRGITKDKNADGYEVTIGTDGEIEIKPEAVEVSDDE